MASIGPVPDMETCQAMKSDAISSQDRYTQQRDIDPEFTFDCELRLERPELGEQQ